MLVFLAAWGALLAALLCLLALVMRRRSRRLQQGRFTIGFFHPHCNSGGGGERVLWQYIRILQASLPSDSTRLVIYTGDTESSAEILAKTQDRFGITIRSEGLEFVRLRWRKLIDASSWPRFTLIGQSVGSVILALEALWQCVPHVYVDTTGWAFTMPLARFVFNCKVHCYTHYPTISDDMLRVVFERRPAHNNSQRVSGNILLARAKWIYYKLFAALYSGAGRSAHLAFVNSTWTRGHIDSLWRLPAGAIHTVYPPCDTANLQRIPLGMVATWPEAAAAAAAAKSSSSAGQPPMREDMVMSLAQFRPEKDHSLQLRAFALFLSQMRERAEERGVTVPSVTLVLLGGVRDEGDAARVEELRSLASSLGIGSNVVFEINQPFSTVQSYLSRSLAALHTMWNEHFGIGVVEFMAAGAIPIAHDSGGPALDIVVRHRGQPTGYRATSVEQYAAALLEVFASEVRGSADMQRMREAARTHAASFSDEVFEQQLHKLLMPFLHTCQADSESAKANTTSAARGSKNSKQQ